VRARFSQESAWEKWPKGIILGFAAFYLVIATISGFRAIVQIYSVKISAPALLGRVMLAANRNPVFDPRPQSSSLAVTPTSHMLADFENGPAEIRSIARGRSQFLRVPPPTIATATVQISK
jgi:hypothetical protein